MSKKPFFPPWFPLISLPLIFLVRGYIYRPQQQRITPQIQTPPRSTQVDVLEQTCRQCRILGDCSAFPFCTTSQRTCEWRQNWDGKWIQDCRSF